MVQLDGDDAARLWVLDLECAIENTDLEPMIAIKLRDQVSSLVTQSELLGVSREHDLGDVDAKQLTLLGLAQTVEQDVVDGAFLAANDRFSTVLVQVHRLVLHVDLLLQLQVTLAEDEDFSFKSDIDVRAGPHGREDFDSLTLAIDRCNQTEIIAAEEVDLVRVLPNQLVLIALQLVSPRQDQLRPNILDVSRLEVIKLHGTVGAVVDAQRVMRGQLHLLKL